MKGKYNYVVLETIGIIIVYGIILQTLGIVIFSQFIWFYSSGLWIGIMLAVFMLISMYRSLQRGFEEIASASKHVMIQSVLRYIIVVVVFALVMVIPLGNPYSCFVGVMGLKLAAYLQPVIHRFIIKKNSKEVEG